MFSETAGVTLSKVPAERISANRYALVNGADNNHAMARSVSAITRRLVRKDISKDGGLSKSVTR